MSLMEEEVRERRSSVMEMAATTRGDDESRREWREA